MDGGTFSPNPRKRGKKPPSPRLISSQKRQRLPRARLDSPTIMGVFYGLVPDLTQIHDTVV